jgi:beta-lactamase superfamily II metal-dependent hydrolase
MTWSLAIHHIDLVGNGDATLIIADDTVGGHIVTRRSALIDAGLVGHGAAVAAYLNAALGGDPLDVVVSTHYDQDHVGGLRSLLLMAGLCDDTRIYDQGWPEAGDALDQHYSKFAYAIGGTDGSSAQRIPVLRHLPLGRHRLTSRVKSGVLPPTMPSASYQAPAIGGAINRLPNWLIGQELLWDGVAGGPPANAPRMSCIAANTYVQTAGGSTGPHGGTGSDPRNEKSLALLVTFRNFRYYVAGDLETVQELQLSPYLNATDTIANRVHAMKTSHHGANTASNQAFIDRLRPEAAFISCGTENRYNHPHQDTVDALDNNNITYYLTGPSNRTPTVLGPNALIAGDIANNIRGHIVLNVSDAQAARAVNSPLAGGIFSVSYTSDDPLVGPENIVHTGV